MKKLLLIVSIVLCVSASVFADGFIGVEAGVGIDWMNEEATAKVKLPGSSVSVPFMTMEADTSSINFLIGAAGAHYFTDSIGLGYGFGAQIPMLYKIEDSDYGDLEDAPTTFKADLSFQYKHDFSEKMALEAGLGLFVTLTMQDLYNGVDMSLWQFGLQGNVGISYKFVSSLALRAGTRIYSPFSTIADVNQDGAEYDATVFGIGFIPYIGLAYAY